MTSQIRSRREYLIPTDRPNILVFLLHSNFTKTIYVIVDRFSIRFNENSKERLNNFLGHPVGLCLHGPICGLHIILDRSFTPVSVALLGRKADIAWSRHKTLRVPITRLESMGDTRIFELGGSERARRRAQKGRGGKRKLLS